MAKKQNINTAPRSAVQPKPAPKQQTVSEKEPKKKLALHWRLGLILAATMRTTPLITMAGITLVMISTI